MGQTFMQFFDRILMMQPALLYTGAILSLLWFASLLKVSSFWLFVIAFVFLAQVDNNRMKKLRREIRHDERRAASQAKLLSDLEPAVWINQALEKIWPQFLQQFISQEVLKPLLPWFIDKHMPWTVKKATIQHLDLGRHPPKFWGARTLRHSSGDDHLVMDFCLDFSAAEDMTAVLSVQMAKSVGLGLTTNIHISRLRIEGMVRLGVKLSTSWPYISRLRLCFENAPYVQMTTRPLSTRGMDVSELPLIAGWIERMMADVFEQSLVEPNMLVVDVTKLARCSAMETPSSQVLVNCLDVHEREAIATLKLHIVEAADLKPSDLNGLADPYVRGSTHSHRFRTKVQKKTLKPEWNEEFEIPIASWKLPTALVLRVRDKDQFRDDDLGFCEIDIAKYRGGQNHDLWIALQDIKMGRIHITLEIIEHAPETSVSSDEAKTNDDEKRDKSLFSEKFEVINLGKGDNDGYLSIVSPGQPLRLKNWHQRTGTRRHGSAKAKKDNLESINRKSMVSSSSDTSADEDETKSGKPKQRRFWGRRNRPALISVAKDEQSSKEYLAVGPKGTTVKMNLENTDNTDFGNDLNDQQSAEEGTSQDAEASLKSPNKRKPMKSLAKGLFKQAGKTAHSLSGSYKRLTRKASDDSAEDSYTPTPPVSEPQPRIEKKLPVEHSAVETEKGCDGQDTYPSNVSSKANDTRASCPPGPTRQPLNNQ